MTDSVVTADWLAANRGAVALVDVRDAWEFDGIGHIPGAVNVPFDSFRAEDEGDEGMLPGADVFAELLGAAGIDRDDDIVAYDDTHGVFAARFLVTTELYGHDPDRLYLLNGDFSAWRLDHETTSEATEVEPTTYDIADPPGEESPLVDLDAVVEAIDSDAILVDTREAWEYEEGHIPGAVRLDWRELVDDETRGLKSRDEMQSILDARGITTDRRIVLYCNTARRISHTYLVLRWLGYENLKFYEGSLTEWEAAGKPLEQGD
jgi:thiosulfate/3-mercaptopyruvate sulfurtransferase